MRPLAYTIGLIALAALSAGAQDMVRSTRVSQRASVSQRIGTTDITIVYHSPLVQGRKIFGGIVPYDFVVDGVEYPWRAGSNENTTVQFTHDVFIAGHPLPAGTYGLHMLVSKDEWTLIFSRNAASWGSFNYRKEEDALRVQVHPEKAAFQEWLSYGFADPKPASTAIIMRWERTKVAIDVRTDVSANILADLATKSIKTAEDYLTMAKESLKQNPGRPEEALTLVEQSIAIDTAFRNLMFKSELLQLSGKTTEGKDLEKYALSLAKGFDWYYYGLSQYLLAGDPQKSYKILSTHAEKNPRDWVVHLALGEYYIKAGRQEKVVEHLEKAYRYAGERSKNYARYMYLSNKLILEQ